MFENIRPVSISERAREEIHRIMQTKGIAADYGLRVGVRGGGCGVALMLGFDKRKDDDLAYDIDNIPVYINKKHTMYLMGKQVDFIDDADARGFTFVDETRAEDQINASS